VLDTLPAQTLAHIVEYPVPEPTTLSLVALAALGLLSTRKDKTLIACITG